MLRLEIDTNSPCGFVACLEENPLPTCMSISKHSVLLFHRKRWRWWGMHISPGRAEQGIAPSLDESGIITSVGRAQSCVHSAATSECPVSPPIQPAQAQRRWMICFRGPGPIERTGGTRYTPHVRSSSTMHYTRAYREREGGLIMWSGDEEANGPGCASFGREWRALRRVSRAARRAPIGATATRAARLRVRGRASFCDASPCAWRAAVPCIYAPCRGWRVPGA